ncbi:hypothetical protein [Siphonobacter sp. SORGH_AS_1065]|uniref:hypothetical protein n=1 Tax=Siphonobacter sp. SORGH_AS_1065 TaxID=3041795 RepID=UPI00358FD969
MNKWQNKVNLEGGEFAPFYCICYRSLIFKASQCMNLLFLTCLSATHIGYSSIHIVLVFLVLEESATIEASVAFGKKTQRRPLKC